MVTMGTANTLRALTVFAVCRVSQQAVTANNVSLPQHVSEIMNRWVLQMGFPVVTIDTATGRVSQDHFLLDPDSEVRVKSPYRWVRQVNPGTARRRGLFL